MLVWCEGGRCEGRGGWCIIFIGGFFSWSISFFTCQKRFSPPGISPHFRWTLLFPGHWGWGFHLGIQGEREVDANLEGELEVLAVVCQCLAEGQALGC